MIEDEKNNFKESPIFGGGIYWDWQRILLLIVAVVYLLLGLIASSTGSFKDMIGMFLGISVSLIVPLACIWFADEMGGYRARYLQLRSLALEP